MTDYKKPIFRSVTSIERIQHMGSDEMIARAARVSTGSDQGEQAKIVGLINYLAKNRHTSPFEHTGITYRMEVPITVAREQMRHRTFSYNEISGRYAELPGEFYIPGLDRPLVNRGSGAHPNLQHSEEDGQHEFVVHQHMEAYSEAYFRYQKMLEAGIATEVARNVLPVATFTSYYATGNLHAWFKFIGLRSAPNALHEIRQVSDQILADLRELFPVATTAWFGPQQ